MITVLKNSFTGLVKPGQHNENSGMHGGWMFLLIFLLSVFTAILFVQPISRLKNDKSFDEMFRQLPQFSYSNGQLEMEETLMLPLNSSRGAIFFYLDTHTDMNGLGTDTVSQYAAAYNCSQAMCIVRDGIIVMQAGRANAVPWTSFLSSDTVINNGNLKERFIKFINGLCIVCAVIMSVSYIGIFYFCLLIYALIGLIFNSILNLNSSFGGLYKIAFSVALPLWILKAILCLLTTGGIEMLIKWLIRIAIILYCFFALYLKKQEEEQNRLAMQSAAMSSNTDEPDINSFVSAHELDDEI